MGYTHYWYRKRNFSKAKFQMIVKDFKVAVAKFEEIGVDLAGGNGSGDPEITNTEILFNGKENCGHPQRNLGITWPADGAKGISLAHESKPTEKTETIVTMLSGQKEDLAVNDSDVDGSWFAGASLKQRTCGGDCSHETFYFPVEQETREHETIRDGRVFNFTKTAYKPYDILVNLALIIAKHYLGEDIKVHSDGNLEDWKDAMEVAQELFGYGNDFDLDHD